MPMTGTQFPRTHKAVASIEDERLRRDLSDLATGLDYALEKEDVDLAALVVERLATLAHVLCRTIGGKTAVMIIDGLHQDSQQLKVARPIGPGWDSGRRCDTSGSRSCYEAKNYTCHGDATGCISTGDNFGSQAASYVWGVALLAD